MKEFLLWTLGLQKLAQPESALYSGIWNGEIKGDHKNLAALLGEIIKCESPEAAEKFALTSGGLRTCRALWYCCELLKNIKDGEKLRALAELEYPYGYLLQKGNELDAIERNHSDPDNPSEILMDYTNEDAILDAELEEEEIEEDEEADDSEE